MISPLFITIAVIIYCFLLALLVVMQMIIVRNYANTVYEMAMMHAVAIMHYPDLVKQLEAIRENPLYSAVMKGNKLIRLGQEAQRRMADDMVKELQEGKGVTHMQDVLQNLYRSTLDAVSPKSGRKKKATVEEVRENITQAMKQLEELPL